MNLNDLRDACYANSKEHGFHDVPKSVGDDVALIHSELSEALEDYRAGKVPNQVWYEYKRFPNATFDLSTMKMTDGSVEIGKPCGIPSEMADVIIRVLDFCGKYGIDINQAVLEKMAFNKTRPYRHGKVL